MRGPVLVPSRYPSSLLISSLPPPALSVPQDFEALTPNLLAQDFEALTPNLLARTVETVEGGGLVIMLVSNLSSLTQLYSATMDVHNKLRTESHQVYISRPGGLGSMHMLISRSPRSLRSPSLASAARLCSPSPLPAPSRILLL